MSYSTVENFKYGLDTRKLPFNAPVGTLAELNNAHITSGGEIEKRKAFRLSRYYFPTLWQYQALYGFKTFGLETTATSVYVFGSDAPRAMYGEMVYQQLVHPAVTAGTTYGAEYDATKHAMTEVVFSCVFNSKCFVIAKYADGASFAFYDGVLVNDLTSGLIQPYMVDGSISQLRKIGKYIETLINLDGRFTATCQVEPNEFIVDVVGPYGFDYSFSAAKTTVAGTLVVNSVAEAVGEVAGVSAVGSFAIHGGTASFATGTVTGVSRPADGATVTVGSVVYTFRDTPAITNDVKRGADTDACVTNLWRAIMYQGTPGADYIGTAPNANVQASKAALVLTITSLLTGTVGNAYTLATSSAAFTVSGATLSGAVNTHAITSILVNGVEQINIANPVIYAATPALTAAKVAAAINSFTADPNFTATVNDTVVNLLSPTGTRYNGQAVVVTATGTVCIGNGSFTLAGSAFVLTSVKANGTELLSAAWRATPGTTDHFPTVSASLSTFCSLAVAAINAGTGTHGYLAVNENNIIRISKAITSSLDTTITLAVDTSATTVTPPVEPPIVVPFTGVISPSWNGYTNLTSPRRTDLPFTIALTGGTAPFTYAWELGTGADSYGFSIVSPLAASTYVIRSTTSSANRRNYTVACVVTDARGIELFLTGATVFL